MLKVYKLLHSDSFLMLHSLHNVTNDGLGNITCLPFTVMAVWNVTCLHFTKHRDSLKNVILLTVDRM